MNEEGLMSNVSVVVVDDEPDAADLFALQLEGENEVDVAYGGEEALEVIDHETDVVLLDRRMPDVTGDEVLEAIRKRGYGCRVVMVTAVDPDLDLIDLPFEEYLTKPATGDDVRRAVNEQLVYARYDEAIREYTRIRSKIDVLVAEKPKSLLIDDEGFQDLCWRAHTVKSEIERLFDEHDDAIPIDADGL